MPKPQPSARNADQNPNLYKKSMKMDYKMPSMNEYGTNSIRNANIKRMKHNPY